ncbi:hypothetical protein S83_022482 [Arachis hypogaea]
MVGDFNEIADPMEKKGGTKVNVNACRKFVDWIQRCNLIDLGYIGTKFTWKGPQWEKLDRVFKRLDRALSNVEWRTRYLNAKVEVLVRSNSNHHSLLINLEPELINNRQRPFCFEAMWNLHPKFKDCVKENWNGNTDLHSSLFSLTNMLMRWNKDIFGNIHKRKRELLRRIGGIQRSPSYGRNRFLEDLEKQLNKELEEIMEREEVLWLQKSRKNWIVEGDRNTKYYHTRTIIRRRKNRVLKLRREDGTWEEDQEELENLAVNFFKRLYDEEERNPDSNYRRSLYHEMEISQQTRMYERPSKEEIKKAFFSIRSLKVPGYDGFLALFYKENWDIIQKNCIRFVHQIWENPSLIKHYNQTNNSHSKGSSS